MLPFDYERPCPLCGTESKHLWWEAIRAEEAPSFSARRTPDRSHPRYFKCAACGILYASPSVNPERAAAEYLAAPFVAPEEGGLAATSYAGGMQEHVIPRLEHRHALVDIGAGNGAFLAAAERFGFAERVGLELSRQAIEAAPANVRGCLREEVVSPASLPEKLSAVTAFQVLEHVPNPREVMTTVLERLEKGGAFFVITHNWEALPSRLMRSSSPLFDVQHYQLFSPRSLSRFLQKLGFSDVGAGSFANTYPLAYWGRLLRLPFRLPRWQTKIHAGNFWLAAFK